MREPERFSKRVDLPEKKKRYARETAAQKLEDLRRTKEIRNRRFLPYLPRALRVQACASAHFRFSWGAVAVTGFPSLRFPVMAEGTLETAPPKNASASASSPRD